MTWRGWRKQSGVLKIVRTVPERMRLAQDAQHNINSTMLAVEDDRAKPMDADDNAGSFRIGRCRNQSEMAPRPRVRRHYPRVRTNAIAMRQRRLRMSTANCECPRPLSLYLTER